MRKLFRKQRFNRFLSVILVMALLLGVVGVYPMIAQANEEIVPEGIFTVKELGSIATGYGLTTTQTTEGVKVGYSDETATSFMFGRVGTLNSYQLDEYGIHVDVTDIACTTREDYSFIVYFGNTVNALYGDPGYMLVYENSGVFSIVASGKGSGLLKTPIVVGPDEDVNSLNGSLSLDIKLIGTNYVITVNGSEYTIPTQYSDETNGTALAITNTEQVYLSFAILDDGLADSSWAWDATFAGATYTIKSVAYNVGGVTLDSSSVNMVVNQTTDLTANVYPENVSNKTVTWESSDTSIATVDENGNVTAVAEGVATITATSTADTTKSATCEVKVVKSELGVEDFTGVSVTEASYDDASDNIGVQIIYPKEANGGERIRTVNTYPMQNGTSIQIDNITGEEGLYSVVVAIGNDTQQWYDKQGYMLVYGQSGNVTIMQTPCTPSTATAITSSKLEKLDGSLNLKIQKQDSDYIISVNGTELPIPNASSILDSSGEHYLAFGVMSDFTLTDGVASDLKYWQYGYYDQAWGSIGRTQDVSYIIRSITVSPSSVALDKEYVNMLAEETTSLTATVSPLVASQNVNWSAADETIATVNADGTVTAVKAGTTIITATSKTDASITSSCVVRVTEPDYITTDDLSSSNSPTLADVGEGVKVTYTAETDAWRRLQTKYDTTDETKNSTVNGYWPRGNGLHFGFKDIQLTNDTDTLAIFMSKRSYSNSYASWYDKAGYMILYGKDGSFAVVETGESWSNNYIADVLVSEKREELGERLSLDIREEDGVYQLNVNGKTYSVPSEGDDCPVECSDSERVYFSFGLVTGFSVTDAGVMNGPAFKTATVYGSDGTFTLTDISYITTQELTLASYIQSASAKISDGDFVLGADDIALTTALATTTFDGTFDDSCEELVWEVKATDTGYYIKKVDGDENSYLNISADGVSIGAAQALTMERVSDTTTAYTTISDGTNYLCVSEGGVTVSTTAGKLILYSVTPELAEVTDEEPLFTLSAFSDLHSERKFTDTEEEYIRDGIVEATQKVREEDNANVIAFLGDLISNKSYDATDAPQGYWLGTGEDIEEQWTTSRDKMYAAATSATESGRALYLTGNHEYAIGSLDANNPFNSGDYTDGIESKLPELTAENAYFQQSFPEGTSKDIIDAGHVLSYHYNIDGMDIIAINTSYTGTEITSGWSYDLGALAWMEQELAEIGDDKTVLILGHYPTSSLNNDEGGMDSYEKIKGIFEKYPNVIYLYGHNHNPYIHTDTYQRVQTFAEDGVTEFQNRYETPTGYTEVFAGSLAYAKDVGLDSTEITGTAAVVQGLLVKVYSDRIVLQMKNYSDEENPLGVDTLREYTIMRDVRLNVETDPQEAVTEEYTSAFANFRDGEEMEAPVAPAGYVFAGWYYDETCTEPVTAGTTTVAEGKQIFAKFLPEDVLSVQAQSRYSTTDGVKDTSKIDLRLVTMVDNLKYKEVGFLVTNRSGTVKRYSEHYAFTDLTAAGYNFEPGDFNDCCTRFITVNMVNIPISGTGFTADREIPVQAYWVTLDGTTVYGPARMIKVSTAVANVGNAN